MSSSITSFSKVVNQLLNHSFDGEELSDDDLVYVYKRFVNSGGSWESMFNGDYRQIKLLIKCIKEKLKQNKNLSDFSSIVNL